jgi:hypothetical protein
MSALPKDHPFLERPYSGKAILYTMLRKGPVAVKDYQKELKTGGRKITALPRVLYWVGKAVEEYGYDLEVAYDEKSGEPKSLKLIKSAKPAKPAKKTKKASKPAKKAKTVVKTKKAKSKKKESESSEPESEPESDEPESGETES